jgi:acylphosphatase
MTIRRRVRIHGRVQGVFFRDTCRRRARGLEVSGWVRNTDDGGVEAVFEGEPDAVDQMVAWCRHGPSGAVVSGIDVASESPQGDQGFRVG